jgi:maltose-binding protein MalE
MAPKWQWKLIISLAVVFLMSACTSGESEKTTTTEDNATTTTIDGSSSTSTSQQGQEAKLVVWIDEARAPIIESAAINFEAAYGAVVEIEMMPFREIRGAVMSAISAGEGPDVFIDSNEGTGALVEAGIIAPLELEGREAEFLQVAIDAFSYEGDVYGVPFVIEAVGLFYNKDFVQEPPADFAALRSICDDLGYPTGDGVPCLAIPFGEPLHQFPFLAGFGGYVFGFEDGAYNVADVGLDSSGAVEGAAFLENLYQDGYADAAVDYSAMADLFNQGAVPFMWTGPWQGEAVDAAGINYGVATLPRMDGNPPRPFVGSQGFFLNELSERAELAMSFLLDHIATTEAMVQLSEVTKRPPALRSALDEVAGDTTMAAFAESGIGGLPFPNLPEMDAVWEPLTDAFAVLGQGFDDPAAVMARAADLVRSELGAG